MCTPPMSGQGVPQAHGTRKLSATASGTAGSAQPLAGPTPSYSGQFPHPGSVADAGDDVPIGTTTLVEAVGLECESATATGTGTSVCTNEPAPSYPSRPRRRRRSSLAGSVVGGDVQEMAWEAVEPVVRTASFRLHSRGSAAGQVRAGAWRACQT
jgi:hypothetical protein